MNFTEICFLTYLIVLLVAVVYATVKGAEL